MSKSDYRIRILKNKIWIFMLIHKKFRNLIDSEISQYPSVILIMVSFFQDINDFSGFRIYTTTNYRPNEIGVFFVGATITWNE